MKFTKKTILLSVLSLSLAGLLVGCGNSSKDQAATDNKSESDAKTVTFHADNGDVQVPAHPKRIVDLSSSYTGNLLSLGVIPVGVRDWPKNSKFYEGKLDAVETVDSDALEKVMKLNPDLIITQTDDKNIKKLSEIAPTVAFKYEEHNYLDMHVEIGKLVGKEKEAQDWVTKWKDETKKDSEQIKKAIGPDATAMVMESFGKDLYVYGNNWARGTEIIYQALGIKAPEKVKQEVMQTGYKAISAEVIPQFAGDYIFLGDGGGTADNAFLKTDIWKGIPAVQKNHVFTFESNSFYFNDPISLEKERAFIVHALTQGK